MGKKGNWFGAVKRVFSPESKEKKEQGNHRSKKKWGFGKSRSADPSSSSLGTSSAGQPASEKPPTPAPPPPNEQVKITDAETEQSKHAYSVAIATAVAAEAAVAAAQAAAEVVRLTTPTSRYSGKSREDIAAIKIQTAFRGYLARRALRALRGLVRLKELIDGQSVKRQATTTLRCMQTLARVQSQIRSRRIRMTEENLALQRQLQLKCERERENLRASMGDDWDDSMQSKEQIETSLLHKQEATIRRERALAYAFTHQQMLKNPSRSVNPMFMDPNNPQWGWSWLERWMAARPWESRSATDREPDSQASVKSASISVGGEITKAYARRDLTPDRPPLAQKLSRPASRHSPSTPSKASSITGKIKPASPRGGWGQDDDSRSILSLQSHRQHSIAGSSVRDDESLASSPAVPNYMTPTQSAKAKSRLQSPLSNERPDMTPDRVSVGSVKKRLSFPAAEKHGMVPAVPRRHSGPPKVDIGSASVKDIAVNSEISVGNGGSK
ncbi:Protein IQ-DOMAIN 1 [Acorus calamus]|uniref:Protein IQ-DOMAIN 1 n=1 Tax=Acorus calamus TaxID=4465 RepID=A0AAV9F5L7_ACOCL|nr:Protein IQ-DOMAIN 1 [Acorus calamus]